MAKGKSRSANDMKNVFFKNAPLGLVLLLAAIVVLETGIVIGGYIYYQKLVEMSGATETPTLRVPKVASPTPSLPVNLPSEAQ